VARLPPTSFFLTSALFHYLGPALAVLLFAHLAPLGVMWLRIATAAAVFAIWRRPWQIVARLDPRQRMLLVVLGGLLAGMNSLFYLAVARLPLATVGAIEFLGTVALATVGVRTWRNLGALVVTVGGVSLLTVFKAASDPLGFVFAFGNCAGFFGYLVLGHRIANARTAPPGRRPKDLAGIDQLGASMILAAIAATPIGLPAALPALGQPSWLLWGLAVGVCSSVIPYVTDQLAMARLPRATFALMLALLPACATLIGTIVLRQIPTADDLGGIGLVVAGLVIHQPAKSEHPAGGRPPRHWPPRDQIRPSTLATRGCRVQRFLARRRVVRNGLAETRQVGPDCGGGGINPGVERTQLGERGRLCLLLHDFDACLDSLNGCLGLRRGERREGEIR
jgi:inner membrane transporter RhtA